MNQSINSMAFSERKLSKDGSIHVTDEVYNTLISGLAAVLACIGTFILVKKALATGSSWHAWGFGVYGLSAIALFTSSALHHGVHGSEKLEHYLRQVDYFAIFVMIAGTFTPFCLVVFNNFWGYALLTAIWTLALVGICLKGFFPNLPKIMILGLFILMGWSGVLVIYPLYLKAGWKIPGILLGGGLFFTVGAVIYYLEKPNPVPGKFGFHEIWHLFVVGGASTHFLAVYSLLS